MKPPELFLVFLSALCLLSNASFFVPYLTVKKKSLKIYFFPFLITVHHIKSYIETSLCMLVCASPLARRCRALGGCLHLLISPYFCCVMYCKGKHNTKLCSPSRNEALNQSVEVGVNKHPAVQGAP